MKERRWYLVYTKPHGEDLARVNLERQGYEIYLPRVRQRRRRLGRVHYCIEPLFPRYLFIHLDTVTDNWMPIRSTFGVTRLICFGMDPAMVPDELVAALRARENADGLQLLPTDRFKRGEKVRVKDGPMMGFEGIFLARSSRDRVLVLLDIVGRHTRVNVNVDQLEPAG